MDVKIGSGEMRSVEFFYALHKAELFSMEPMHKKGAGFLHVRGAVAFDFLIDLPTNAYVIIIIRVIDSLITIVSMDWSMAM